LIKPRGSGGITVHPIFGQTRKRLRAFPSANP
jgi:hypothetical protein